MPGIIEPELVPVEAEIDAPPAELPVDTTPPRAYVVLKQSVHLEIDLQNKAVHGRSDIMIALIEDVSEVYIDARQADIDNKSITVSGCTTQASYQDPCEWLDTPKQFKWSAGQWALRKKRVQPLLHHKRQEVSALDHDLKCCQPNDGSLRVKLPSGKEIKQKNQDTTKNDVTDHILNTDGSIQACTISIPFKLKGVTDGLHFVGCDEADTRYPHVYTRHTAGPGTASSIFPCIDDPGSRNPWKVSITCPRTLGDAFRRPKAVGQQQKSTIVVNSSNRKRKFGQEEPEEPPRREVRLTEDDKLMDLTVVCTGYMTGDVICKDDETKKTMTFEIDKNKGVKHIGFAVGPFEHVDLWSEFRTEEDDVKLNVSAVKVHGYCLPGRSEEVKNTCAALVTAVDYFVLQFGRYPFDSYKVCFVDDMVDDTVPLCAFSLYSSRLLYPREVIDTEIETTRTLVHALASQWFGVNIGPNQRADIWLIVGIAWFMTDIFMKMLCGNNEYRFRMKTMSDKLVHVDIKRPSLHDLGDHLYLGDFEVDFMNLKAPLVLFILDRRISKSSSSAGLMRIISKIVSKANTSVQTSDEVLMSDLFRKACEKALGTRLDTFWAQWIYGSGCPRFDVFQRFNKKRLCVEMTVRQIQDIAAAKSRPLDKDEFWREVMEEHHEVYAGELQGSFTGPMTIRIHEADGTPYEHIVDIREDSGKASKFEIPYNTKYKRLKRNRRQRERQLAGLSTKNNEEMAEESKALYSLGDVLQQQEDADEWKFADWDEETENRMDQESYEWIRMDADFEWICDIQTNLPAYMYVSQLQQDKDVVAQQDSMLYLDKSFAKTGPHPLVSTILTRTLLDDRYYYGIRTMSTKTLPKHAAKAVNDIGLFHMQRIFQHFFCVPGTDTPLPNNFADKRQYLVKCVIPEAIAKVRGDDGKCPREARHFILAQLRGNDNSENMYSDHIYISKLIQALAYCQVPDEKKSKSTSSSSGMSFKFGDAEDDEMEDVPEVDPEPLQFRDQALEEIERFRRMDEYSPSYQNCFTVAALDALCTLMKAKVIDVNPVVFVQYLQDKTLDVVRIKACESLVELGLLMNATFLRFLLSLIGTDPSPFVRTQLFKALSRGLASIAIGENVDLEKQAAPNSTEDGLIVEQENTMTEERQKARARKEDLTAALAALKEELKDHEDLHEVIWEALDSPVLSVAERINLLELVSLLAEEDDSLLMNFNYPQYWTVDRVRSEKRRSCVLRFRRHFRTKSRKKYMTPASAPRPEPKRTITLNLNRAPSFSTKPSTSAPVAPAPQPTSGAITIPTPKAAQLPPSAAVIQAPTPVVTTPKSADVFRKNSISVSSSAKPPASPLVEKPAPKPAAPREPPKLERGDSISVSTPVLVNNDRPPAAASAPAPAPAPKAPASKPSPTKGDVPKSKVDLPKPELPKPAQSRPSPGKPSIPSAISSPNISVNSPKISSTKISLPKNGTPKPVNREVSASISASGSILANPKKRPHPEPQSSSGRPTKIIKINTSKIAGKVEQIWNKPKAQDSKLKVLDPKPSKAPDSKLKNQDSKPRESKPRKMIKVKFNAWDRLKKRKDGAPNSSSAPSSTAPSAPSSSVPPPAPSGSSSGSGLIRAAPKHSAIEKTSNGGTSGISPRSSPAPSTGLGRLFGSKGNTKKPSTHSPNHSRSPSLSSPKFPNTSMNSSREKNGDRDRGWDRERDKERDRERDRDRDRDGDRIRKDSSGDKIRKALPGSGGERKALPDSHRKPLPGGERKPLSGHGSSSTGGDRGGGGGGGSSSRDDHRKPLPGSYSREGGSTSDRDRDRDRDRDKDRGDRGGGSSDVRPSGSSSFPRPKEKEKSGSPLKSAAPKIKFKVKAPNAP